MNERRSNRRIRLLLACFVLVFAGTLARAVWLQGVAGVGPRADGVAPASARRAIPAGPRHDLRPDGRAARDRRAGDDDLRRSAQVKQPARASRWPPRRRSASTPKRSTRCWPTSRASFVYVEAEGRPGKGGRAREAEVAGSRLLRGGAALLPAAQCRRARARLRGDRQQGSRRARAVARQIPDRQARHRDDRHAIRPAA